MSVPSAVSLVRRLGGGNTDRSANDWTVTEGLNLARVLAHVRDHDPVQRPMRAAGWKVFPEQGSGSEAGGERPLLSEVRFRRLLSAGRGEEQVSAFTRLIAQLGGIVHVPALAEAFWYWNDRTKRQWAFEYYAAGSASPVLSLQDEGQNA
jgi:CRISPR system Cascade subunit CasB